VVNRVALREALLPPLALQDGMKLFQRLMSVGVPCAPVLTVEEALALDHTETREMVVELDGYRGPGIAIKLDRTPGSVRLPPPAIGAHSREILRRFGIHDHQIEALVQSATVK
jgi:crotonobetainyl-CoA:carnitine CoA-transferase CaiB-like acyl-CoA transferase